MNLKIKQSEWGDLMFAAGYTAIGLKDYSMSGISKAKKIQALKMRDILEKDVDAIIKRNKSLQRHQTKSKVLIWR